MRNRAEAQRSDLSSRRRFRGRGVPPRKRRHGRRVRRRRSGSSTRTALILSRARCARFGAPARPRFTIGSVGIDGIPRLGPDVEEPFNTLAWLVTAQLLALLRRPRPRHRQRRAARANQSPRRTNRLNEERRRRRRPPRPRRRPARRGFAQCDFDDRDRSADHDPARAGCAAWPALARGLVLGAVLALADGLVWAELGSQFPGSGGTYGFLLETFGRHAIGRLLSFFSSGRSSSWRRSIRRRAISVLRTMPAISSPRSLLRRSSQRSRDRRRDHYHRRALSWHRVHREDWQCSALAASILTLLCVIAGSFAHFSPHQAFTLPAQDSIWTGLRAGLDKRSSSRCTIISATTNRARSAASQASGAHAAALDLDLDRNRRRAVYLHADRHPGRDPVAVDRAARRRSLPPLGQHVASAVVERSFGAFAAGVVTILIS